MRDISEIMNKIEAQVPVDFEGKERFKLFFSSLKVSIQYTAPEAIWTKWFELSGFLQQELGDPAGCDWKLKIQSIFSNKE